MDLSHILPEESRFLLPSYQRKEKIKNRPKNIADELNKLVVQKDKNINKELFKMYFGFQSLIDIQGELYKTKNTDKNKELVKVIKNRLVELENEAEEMSKDEIENERLYDIESTVKDILYVNDRIRRTKI